jgi:hypothetical protein
VGFRPRPEGRTEVRRCALKRAPRPADQSSVGNSYLGVRLDALRRAQNADGGWGYFPGKDSWLEPTVYAALALHGDPAADRAWSLLLSWQSRDGSWRPSARVQVASWGTALCVTMAHIRGEFGDPFRNGVVRLVGTAGVESSLKNRAAARVGLIDPGRDLSLKAWPWKPGTSSWVEPTAHSLVALKKAAAKIPISDIRKRIDLGEAQLLDVRCHDGGWNYGSPVALHVDLPSYPETTAVALVGLQERSDLGPTLDMAARWLGETGSPMARAWLTIALRLHGASVPDASPIAPPADLMILALEALAVPEGNHRLLKTEAA